MTSAEALTLLSPALTHRDPGPQPSPLKSHFSTRWADLGCGSGLFTLALATLLKSGSTIYAVDRQPKIRPQTTPNHVAIEPVKADFAKIPLPVRDLDGILMANSLHYVKDKPALIRTLRAVTLRPQHAFLIIEYDTDRATPIWVPYPVSYANLGPLFLDAGYSSITRLADRPSIYNRNKIYSAYIL
jgi:ubiquinone/menaquinone biosynthesis C-methylase UbiE